MFSSCALRWFACFALLPSSIERHYNRLQHAIQRTSRSTANHSPVSEATEVVAKPTLFSIDTPSIEHPRISPLVPSTITPNGPSQALTLPEFPEGKFELP